MSSWTVTSLRPSSHGMGYMWRHTLVVNSLRALVHRSHRPRSRGLSLQRHFLGQRVQCCWTTYVSYFVADRVPRTITVTIEPPLHISWFVGEPIRTVAYLFYLHVHLLDVNIGTWTEPFMNCGLFSVFTLRTLVICKHWHMDSFCLSTSSTWTYVSAQCQQQWTCVCKIIATYVATVPAVMWTWINVYKQFIT